MNVNDTFELDKYDEAYKFVIENNNVIIKDLGNKQYQIVEKPKPTTEEQNEAIRQTRESLYKKLTDELILRKIRKQTIGTWTIADETEFNVKMKELSKEIDENNPYIE